MSESIGKIFKDARRDKGLSIGEVCKKTKIANSVISAIEEDNFDFLSP
ncbi:MAG: helix-turn-helix domain-containing protein, partial [Candidatus Omnitrophota bacterium]